MWKLRFRRIKNWSINWRIFRQHRQSKVSSSSTKNWRDDRIFYAYKYIDCVSTLFEPNSSRPFLVRIEVGNIQAFNEWLHSQRPPNRIESLEKRDEFDFTHGLLYHDACYFHSNLPISVHSEMSNILAVEIKPKQGWNICTLPEWLLDRFGIHRDLRNKCRFCAMQFSKVVNQFYSNRFHGSQGELLFILPKVKEHQVDDFSKYCPSDLFSG